MSMTKHIIKVKDGRAYLHTTGKVGKFKTEGITPLGSNPNFIKRMMEEYRCKVVFL